MNHQHRNIVSHPVRMDRSAYELAIQRLQDGMTQIDPDGRNCAVCGDSGHQAWECHHNPLAMMLEADRLQTAWRCYHCGEVMLTHAEAMLHFGEPDTMLALCQLHTVGVGRIAAERQRQMAVEEFDDAHDAEHTHRELIRAAMAYACWQPEGLDKELAGVLWPKEWDKGYFKPTTRLRNLVKAGALLAAEIDRLILAGEDTETGGPR